jgi:hypothetical protein
MIDRPLPGAFVRHPDRADWGVGQVQSVIGNRITVNFEHAGKLLIDGDVVSLTTIDPDEVD